jgi:hypothetical protein
MTEKNALAYLATMLLTKRAKLKIIDISGSILKTLRLY